jgi:hypothetical protein
MKNLTKLLSSCSVALILCVTSLSAQSCAAVNQFSKASTHALAASGEVSTAVGHSAAGSVRVVSGVAAVPVWMSGAVVAGSGAVVSAVGESMGKGGDAAMKGADDMWDFANGESTKRPVLNREKALPPRTTTPEKAKDPSPAEVLGTKVQS